MRSCWPFWCGEPGSVRSGTIPRRIHQTASEESRPSAWVAKGDAVIGADPLGEAVLAEEALEDGAGLDQLSAGEGLGLEQALQEDRIERGQRAVGPMRLIGGTRGPERGVT